MPSQDIKYTTRNNETFDGYLTAPDSDGKYPGLLYITAISGADETNRKLGDAWAEDGFVVSMPDIFWRPTTPEQRRTWLSHRPVTKRLMPSKACSISKTSSTT